MIIGITTTRDEITREFDIPAVERLNLEYLRRVFAAGGTPVMLPPVPGSVEGSRAVAHELIDRVDGLLLSGGGDVHPARYGEARGRETALVVEERDALELELARLAHERDVPTLGICRGLQVMNVALGGSLYQDVNLHGVTDEQHRQLPPYETGAQRVRITPGTRLAHALLGDEAGVGGDAGGSAGLGAGTESDAETWGRCVLVNSMHHQAVKHLAAPLRVSAVCDDGVIEGVEDPSRRFYLAVQWHPEYLDDNAPLFKAFVDAVRSR